MSQQGPQDSRRRFLLLVVVAAVVGAAGYTGYLIYPRFDLPATQGLGLLGLAAAAGIAAFFSPCSFPLLLTLVAGHTIGARESGRRPVRSATALAFGAAVFLTVVGLVIAAGGQGLFASVTFTSSTGIVIRLIVGLVLVLFGLGQAEVLKLSMHGISRAIQPRFRPRLGVKGQWDERRMAVFGFGYVLAGFG